MTDARHPHASGSSDQQKSPLARARELESDLKRALYGAVERVQATKGALYLATNHGIDCEYEIVTSYSYNAADRTRIGPKDAIVSRLQAAHGPIVINSMSVDPAAAEVLFRQQNERLLALPIVGRGRRLVGVVDLRDKARGKPFDAVDVAAAETVCDDIRRILRSHDLYGIGAVPLVDAPVKKETDPALVIQRRRAHTTSNATTPLSPEAMDVVRRAHAAMQKRGLTSVARRRFATVDEARRMAMLVPGVLVIRGAVAAALTVMKSQWIVASGPITPGAVDALRSKTEATASEAPAGVNVIGGGPAVTAARLRYIGTFPIAANVVEEASLTIAFEIEPDEDVRRRLDAFFDVFSETAAAVIGRSSWDAQREAVAARLVEPDLQRLPALAEHSQLVAGIAHRLALALGLPERTAELIRIAGLVHDVGLRLLDYDRLIGNAPFTPEYERAFREHPLVGASIVSASLGSEVAEAVLHHHERWDGNGYPGRLVGSNIPPMARVIAIADNWVLLRSPW
ncbi:MAG: HD domain-containing phosphohydrolase, partial [Thermoanaerobaculia bacterium]